MRDLTKLPNKLDAKQGVVRAVIETPKGRRGKYDYDPKSGLFRLKTLLPDGLSFPLDFGFIPSTLCDDGDPQDIMVLVDEPNPVGALIEARLIGVIEAEQIEDGKRERNDRLLAVAAVSHLYAKIHAADDLEAAFLDNLTQFWVNKGELEGKLFRPMGVKGPREAVKLVKRAAAALKEA